MNGIFSFFRLRPHDDGSVERGRMGRVLIDELGLKHLEDYHGHALRDLPAGPMSAETKDRLARMMSSRYMDVRAWDDHLGDADTDDIPEEELNEPMVPDVQALPGKPPSVFQYSRAGMDGAHIVEAHGDQLLLDGQALSPAESKALLANVHTGAALLRYHRPPPDGTPHIPGTPDFLGKAENDTWKPQDVAKRVSAVLTPDLLHRRFQGDSERHPVAGHCYAASEAVYHMMGGKEGGWTPMQVEHEGGPHWFLNHPQHGRMDLTSAQFKSPVPYDKAKGKGFLTKEPSARARFIMERVLGDVKKEEKTPHGEVAKERANIVRDLLDSFEKRKQTPGVRSQIRHWRGEVEELAAAGLAKGEGQKLVGDTIKKDMMIPKLGNLYALEERATRDDGSGAVVAIDLNDFAKANEVGWREADEAIVAFGQALAKAAGGDAYRDGGDGFVAFCDSRQDAYAMLRELSEAIKELPPVGGSYRITMAAGVGETLPRAKAALAIAKQSKYRSSSEQAEDSVYTAGSDNLIS